MSLPSATLALLTCLLIVGCATKEPPPTAAQTQLEEKTHLPRTVHPAHPDLSSGAMSGDEWEWSKVNPKQGGFQ